jgi:hypothetical protein
MTARRVSFISLSTCAVLACLGGAGCNSTPATATYTPYQGVNIDTSSLVAPYGCGMGPGQVYRYVATIALAPGVPDASDAARSDGGSGIDAGPAKALATGVFDCFADGVFEGLSPGSFVLTIDAFTFAESEAVGLACDAEASPCAPPELDAGAPISGYSWTTTCTATVEAGASVVAQCGPLEAPTAAISDGSATDSSSDSSAAGDSSVDATAAADGPFGDTSTAADGAPNDATLPGNSSSDSAADAEDAGASEDAGSDGSDASVVPPSDAGGEGGG